MCVCRIYLTGESLLTVPLTTQPPAAEGWTCHAVGISISIARSPYIHGHAMPGLAHRPCRVHFGRMVLPPYIRQSAPYLEIEIGANCPDLDLLQSGLRLESAAGVREHLPGRWH
jgi:hypothetical protein